ncbi:hypothetical protein DdX_10880 [Ditylenchus destructor]|uniref:Uncharacterized protein n=1 Tax=Ditylenchus destructor TaxID=166010 RepID=A0AAD4R542_9BILA|nr:hypothetical protein DdX_10880 [Ditylenchus destructor]
MAVISPKTLEALASSSVHSKAIRPVLLSQEFNTIMCRETVKSLELDQRPNQVFTHESDVASMMCVIRRLYYECEFVICEPEHWTAMKDHSWNSIFAAIEEDVPLDDTKQWKYLKEADLQLETIQLCPSNIENAPVWKERKSDNKYPIYRNIAEQLLVHICDNPGITVEKLQLDYKLPKAILDYVIILLVQTIESCEIFTIILPSLRLTSPFDQDSIRVPVKCVFPKIDAFERFVKFFEEEMH